jgi:hypothetical protein
MKLISTPQLQKLGKKTLAVCAGVVAACSLALGSLASTPDELFSGVPQVAPVVAAKSVDDSATPKPAEKNESKKQSRFRSWLNSVFFSQPSVVRGVVLLPFWAVGKVLLALLSLLFTALSPILQILLGILLNAALLFGLFALLLKLLFPNLRWRDIFTKRNILLLTIGSVLLSVADTVLRAYWEDYRPISIAIKLGFALVILSLLCWRILGKRQKAAVVSA